MLKGLENNANPDQEAVKGKVLIPNTPSNVIHIDIFIRTEARKINPPLKIAANPHDKLELISPRSIEAMTSIPNPMIQAWRPSSSPLE